MFVCVHSTVLGPAGGGTRLRVYPDAGRRARGRDEALGAMTRKMAGAGMPRGGGKAVLAVPELPTGEARRRLLLRYGELVASLGGTYRTAGDMNISPADLDVVAETCPLGLRDDRRAAATAARGTAIAGAARDPRDRRARLRLAGARRAARARAGRRRGRKRSRRAARGRRARRVLVSGRRRGARRRDRREPSSRRTTCSAPSATSTRRARSAGRSTRSRSRASAAARSRAARTTSSRSRRTRERLHERGILYAPDYVVNAGGVIQLVGLEDLGWDEAELERGLAGIGDTLRDLFGEADAAGITPAAAAEQLVAERVAAARAA